jgi:hypothetical protein
LMRRFVLPHGWRLATLPGDLFGSAAQYTDISFSAIIAHCGLPVLNYQFDPTFVFGRWFSFLANRNFTDIFCT